MNDIMKDIMTFLNELWIHVLDYIAPRHEFNWMNSIKKGKKLQFLASFAGKWLLIGWQALLMLTSA